MRAGLQVRSQQWCHEANEEFFYSVVVLIFPILKLPQKFSLGLLEL